MDVILHIVTKAIESLFILLGDQLDLNADSLVSLNKKKDLILMMEVEEESRHVPSHKKRTVLFLSAMRHAAEALRKKGFRVQYVKISDPKNSQTFEGEIDRCIKALHPQKMQAIHPGEWRVLRKIQRAAKKNKLDLEIFEDKHFLVTPEEFRSWAQGRQELTMEYFYREQRKRFSVLMENKKPVGGAWNFDKENRKPFRGDVDSLPKPSSFPPDKITKEVMRAVDEKLADLPGNTEDFDWPVTAKDAQVALRNFVDHRLADFGSYQDAMVTGAPTMFHSLISCALNLKLLDPRDCIKVAEEAYHQNKASLASVEGFIRQILGWREFIRGVYWHEGEEYENRNELEEHGNLPTMYWSGDSDMLCMQTALQEVHAKAYGHHIQRLMVTGNFALIAGVDPKQVSDWYLGMYVDAIDWVTLPNTLGMAMHADGGVVGTKPYAASGQYIKRMSNYCSACSFDPARRYGDDACPMTTFYWDFLLRHQNRFKKNRRMTLTLKHLDKMSTQEKSSIRKRSRSLRVLYGIENSSRKS